MRENDDPTTTLGDPTLSIGPLTATPPAALEFTPQNVPCLRLCRHYFNTLDHFDAQNSGRRFVESTHLCTAIPGVQLPFSADEPPYECNRWDPLQPHELGPLEHRRSLYYAAHPDHVPLPLEERLMVDIDEPEDGNTEAAREYLDLCRLAPAGLPEDLVLKANALWAYLGEPERKFVSEEIEYYEPDMCHAKKGTEDGDHGSPAGDPVRDPERHEGPVPRREEGVREEHLSPDGGPGGDGEGPRGAGI